MVKSDIVHKILARQRQYVFAIRNFGFNLVVKKAKKNLNLFIVVDIQGPDWKKPRFRTHAKMLWDDTYLYIGAFLQETDVWANQTKHDSVGM